MPDTKPLILLIDDDEVLRTTLGSALEGAGYQVTLAEDGQKGLTAALSLHPALILLDYQMPSMDGLEVIRQLRADSWGNTASIIFETNAYDVAAINEVMQLGVKDYIMKSDMSLDSLLELVATYVPAPST